MNKAGIHGRANGPPALDAVDAPPAQTTQSWSRNAPRWLPWTVGAVIAVVCTTVFLLWGFYGPTYIFDLIAAYCG
jgi:hypothetical protein